MPVPDEKKLLPPYASYIGVWRFLETLRADGEHLPDQIDRTVLRNLSGSGQTSMLKTLEAMGLIDAIGKPTAAMRALLQHPRGSDAFKAAFKPIIEKTYTFLFSSGINLKTATTSQVQTAFRGQDVTGSTVSKCIAFFLAAAKDAGIEVSKYVRTPPMAEGVAKKRTPAVRNSINDNEEDDEIQVDQSALSVTSDLHPALQGVLRTLPAPGEPLTAKERQRFMAAFEAVMLLAHPSDEE